MDAGAAVGFDDVAAAFEKRNNEWKRILTEVGMPEEKIQDYADLATYREFRSGSKEAGAPS